MGTVLPMLARWQYLIGGGVPTTHRPSFAHGRLQYDHTSSTVLVDHCLSARIPLSSQSTCTSYVNRNQQVGTMGAPKCLAVPPCGVLLTLYRGG
jgi:hypothetical protein